MPQSTSNGWPRDGIAEVPRDPLDDQRRSLSSQIWVLLKESFSGFFEDEALTRRAAISFYAVTSIGPVMFIVVAIAGLAFGEKAATGAMAAQLAGLIDRRAHV